MSLLFFDQKLEQFIQTLEKPAIAKVLRTLDLLERFGHNLGMPHSKKIGSRIFELRVHGQQEIRIIYVFHHGRIVLLHGFIKKSQRLPSKEIDLIDKKLRALDTL